MRYKKIYNVFFYCKCQLLLPLFMAVSETSSSKLPRRLRIHSSTVSTISSNI